MSLMERPLIGAALILGTLVQHALLIGFGAAYALIRKATS